MTNDLTGMQRNAVLSPCGRFRFSLSRRWGDGPIASWLMLNPSTADAEHDDPTLRRICDFAAKWGLSGVTVVNVYPFRAPKPSALWKWVTSLPTAWQADLDAIEENRRHIAAATRDASHRMLGFGAEVGTRHTADLAAALNAYGAEGLMCLGLTEDGWPKHPMARGVHRIPDYASQQFWHIPESTGATP